MGDQRAATSRDWREMHAWATRLVERSGDDVPTWNRRIAEAGIDSEPELRAWLTERGTTGYAQMILVMERFGYPDFFGMTADELIDGQYAGRQALRPVLDLVVVEAGALGELVVQARRTYVSLVTPRRTFAVVRPTTRTRVDLGLRLPQAEPGGRLLAARSLGDESINVRIGLEGPESVDDEALRWLRRAYEANS